MNNIQESSKKIKKIYDNLSYFDQYGGQVFLFIILSILVFIVYSYCAVMLNIQPIKDNWATQRCNPKVIPFAGFINKKPGQTISHFTQENFTYCVQNILKSITGYAVQPLTYITSMLENIYLAILNDIQKIRQMIDNVRNSMAIMAKEVMGRILNMMIPLQQIIIAVKDTISKIQGILTAGLFTSLGTYYALKSLLGAIVEFIVIILFVLLALILILWIIPFTWPFAAVNSAIFLAIAIPLTIIVVFLTQVLGVQTTAVPSLKCFDKNTLIELSSGEKIPICNVKLGDKLKDNCNVTAKFTLDAKNLEMYNLNDVIVSGCHKVKFEEKWIPVSDHPLSQKIENYIEPYLYCLNTSNKVIKINGIIYSDWDEIYDDTLDRVKECIANSHNLQNDTIKNSDIHKYFDGGFVENTIICLKGNIFKKIKDVKIWDILLNGEEVYGLVEIDGLNIDKQFLFNLGKTQYFAGGTKLNFFDKNLGQTSTLNIDSKKYIEKYKKSKKLYHLLTNRGTFFVRDLQFYDYNSCVDFLF